MSDSQPLKLVDLVPLSTLERIGELFEATVGVPMTFTDETGLAVTTVQEPLRFCGTLVRTADNETVCLRRVKWDAPEPKLEDKIRTAHDSEKPVFHRCMGGFRDMAAPLVVEGRTIGFAVFARSLTEEPDVEGFRQMAVAGSMPAELGEAVAQHAVVMSAERVTQVAQFLQVITGLVVSAAYELLRARKVMELEKLRDDLIQMIVHDMRTPLTGILTGLETIIDTDYEDELTREFVPMAVRSSETLLEMVNTLLDIHKMESGAMQLHESTFDFGVIAAEALDQVRGIATSRDQELSLCLEPACGPLHGDEEKIRRVVVNLLGNALKFTQSGGHIALSSWCAGDRFCFAVSDDGPGIPPEYQEKVFDKFGQVEARSEGHKHSTGLGLTFCKMVAVAHGGSIGLQSAAGKGTTFTVALPNGHSPQPQA